MTKQVKSKQRVADHGEVFTAEREVNAMLDLVKQETENIHSRFLEPACGDGNFLVEILRRKLAIVKDRYGKKAKKDAYDWERYSLVALGSIYGVDIMQDNCIDCRNRLYDIWAKEYLTTCGKKNVNEATCRAARFILERNIICGNALDLRCVDENGESTSEPIVFSQWSFMSESSPQIRREDFIFEELVNGKKEDKPATLLDALEEDDDEGTFVQRYITHYRRLGENDTTGGE